MFSSNQILQISGSLNQLEAALQFAFDISGNKAAWETHSGIIATYQITKDKRYCIGWASKDDIPNGWKELPFRPNAHIIAEIIRQYMDENFKVEHEIWDGSYKKGFLMEAIPESLASEYDGILSPYYGIVLFKPYTVFYSK